jgi:hypothetical protein
MWGSGTVWKLWRSEKYLAPTSIGNADCSAHRLVTTPITQLWLVMIIVLILPHQTTHIYKLSFKKWCHFLCKIESTCTEICEGSSMLDKKKWNIKNLFLHYLQVTIYFECWSNGVSQWHIIFLSGDLALYINQLSWKSHTYSWSFYYRMFVKYIIFLHVSNWSMEEVVPVWVNLSIVTIWVWI